MSTPYILMLEDDNDDRLITESFFREKGYDIDLEFVTHGFEVKDFLSVCESTKTPYPNLIILDKNVPIGSGIEVLRELKEHPIYRKIPVVVVSGTALPHEVHECYALGANSYISKPSTDARTSEKIESFVNYWFNVVDLPA